MIFKISTAHGKSVTVDSPLSYEWSRDISAACDGLRLSFFQEESIGEALSVEAVYNGETVFFGYVDYQSSENGRAFIYARSSASLLVDNEAPRMTYNSPCVNSLFAVNAEPLGFKCRLKNYYVSSEYTVTKGVSRYGAINNFVRSFTSRGILVSPQGELYIPDGRIACTVNENRILSEKKIIRRGSALSRIDYKTDGDYVHHRESVALAEKGINRTRYVNVSSVPLWQRANYLSNRITDSAKDYYSAEITVSGIVTAELYSPVVLSGYEDYYITALVTAFNSQGAKTKITLFKRLEMKEADYVA